MNGSLGNAVDDEAKVTGWKWKKEENITRFWSRTKLFLGFSAIAIKVLMKKEMKQHLFGNTIHPVHE